MKILPSLYSDLYVRFDTILGYSRNIQLENDGEIISKSFTSFSFLRVKNEKTAAIDYNSVTFSNYKHLNEFLYLQHKSKISFYSDPLVEKRLGKNEEINVQLE
jgi:hypothetical protein